MWLGCFVILQGLQFFSGGPDPLPPLDPSMTHAYVSMGQKSFYVFCFLLHLDLCFVMRKAKAFDDEHSLLNTVKSNKL